MLIIVNTDTPSLLLYAVVASTTMIIILVIIVYRQLTKANEQSHSLALQKEEIEAQRDALLSAAEKFEEAQRKIEFQNKKINEALDTFLYRVSHDIRGPLATIMGLCYIMRMDKQADINEYKDFFQKIDFLTKKMNKVLLKVANVSKVNYKSLEYQKINLSLIFEQCLRDLETEDKFNKDYFHILVEPDVEEFFTDQTLLEIILASILENSVQYSYANTELVTPYIQITVAKNAQEEVVFEIRSNTTPIPQEVQDKIFNMFYRATNLSQGAGLGLYIARVAVEKLDGKIELAYSNDKETAFVVTIPNKNLYYKYE